MYDISKEIIIRTRKELFNNLQNNAENIVEIVVNRSNLNDITKICGSDLKRLKILKLPENCITDIKPLKEAKFEVLEKLNFNQIK